MNNEEKEMITEGNWDKFLTLNGEKLLLVKRRHPFVVFAPILLISFIFCIMVIMAGVLFTAFFPSFSLFITVTLLLLSILFTFITKSIMDWYFHLYILTTRKVLEVWYAPLYAHVMNDVLLDQVNCTQVDFRRSGFLNELLDIGDVVLTFDRPTHQEEFVFKDVNKCYKLGVYLTRKLLDGRLSQTTKMQPIWFKSPYRGIRPARS